MMKKLNRVSFAAILVAILLSVIAVGITFAGTNNLGDGSGVEVDFDFDFSETEPVN